MEFRTTAMIFLLILGTIVLTESIVNYFGRNENFESPDIIVVLGCGNKIDKPLLNDRLEAALRAHLAYPNIPILLTGDEKNKAEITSMSKYMRSKNTSAQILLDPNSLTTWDSFNYIKKQFPNAKLLVVTNEFHQKRALLFAKLQKLSAKSYGKDMNYSNTIYLFLRERLARLLIYKHLPHIFQSAGDKK